MDKDSPVRYKAQVSVKLHDISLLLMSYYAFHNTPMELGECRDDGTYQDLCRDIDIQSEVWVTPKQLYDLIWYYKQAVVERVKFFKCTMPRNYQPMLLSLKRSNPELFKEDADGEIVMRDSPDITKYEFEKPE